MIRDHNIADDANIQLHKILGATGPSGQLMTGELFWVGNSGDAAYNAMRTKVSADHLFTSIDTAVGKCVANRGDTIAVMEGHTETVIAAGGLDLDTAGITVVFLGTGTSQACITFTTAVTASMTVDAADITLIRPKFVAGIDSLTGPIDVNKSDFTMIDGEWHDATNIETTDCIITDANATRLKIDGWKYFSVTETGDQKQSHIQLNGCDDIVLKNIDIRGDFYVGCVENVTDEVLNMRGENWYLENLNATPKPALYLDANATGSMKNVKLKIASGSTYTNSVGKMSWDDRCEGFMGDGYAGEPIGTVLSSGVEGKVESVGVQASTLDSKLTSAATSVGTGVSTAASLAGSVGAQATSVGTGTSVTTSVVQSAATSVGTGVSTAASLTGSVGAQATSVGTGTSVTGSKADSVGIQTSTLDSKVTSAATSVGTGVSIAASSAQSVGIQASTLDSKVVSTAASIGTGTSVTGSKADSVGLTASTGNSKADSVGTYVSTVDSKLESLALIISVINSKT